MRDDTTAPETNDAMRLDGPVAVSPSVSSIPEPAVSPPDRSIVLVGLMGSGKTSVGRKLARTLDLPFADADDEIEVAAGMTIADIFQLYGEPAFRDLERRVVSRLLAGPVSVLALGGGAFVDPDTRAEVKEKAISFWLRASVDTLVARTSRRKGTRPLLLADDPRAVLERLARERAGSYAQATFAVESDTRPAEHVVAQIIDCLRQA